MTARIGVLEMGRVRPEVVAQHGDYLAMFSAYLKDHGDFAFDNIAVSTGAPVPLPGTRDGWIITGSAAGVYEDHPWLPPMRSFVRQVLEGQKQPMLGICFGHQLMAQSMGGTVEKSPKGRGLGVQSYTLDPRGAWLLPGVASVKLSASHQDQVIVKPKDAAILAHSNFCEFACLAYGTTGLSFQPHPEFTAGGAHAINSGWQQRDPIDPKLFEQAEATFKTVPLDSPKLAPAIAAFLSGKHAA